MSYSYKQWTQDQTADNVIHASDCERWQAGIELAGGTWDGSWTDLDTSGKGLITIDQFNALESQIQSKVSSYTPKNYDPDSTVQIVPGPDGWNKVEDGILKAVCEPDGVNRNWLLATREFPNTRTGVSSFNANSWTRTVDEDGFGVMTRDISNSASFGVLYTTVLADDDQWAGKTFVLSADMLCDVLKSNLNRFIFRIQIFGTNNFSSYTQAYYRNLSINTYIENPDDVVNGEWCRPYIKYTMEPLSELVLQSADFDHFVYAFGIQHGQYTGGSAEWSTKKLKVEIADEPTPWSDNPEDYGGSGDFNTLTASPQSVEDSDEVVAPEAEEIE